MDYPERPECDFTNYDYRGRTQCGHCGKVVLQSEAITVKKHIEKGTIEEHFCTETCANEWYLERLRGSNERS